MENKNTILPDDKNRYMVLNTEMSYFFDKTYNDINFKIGNQYIDDECISSLFIDSEYICEVDIPEIAEGELCFKTIIPDYIKDLMDVSDVVKDVYEEMKELCKTWQW